MRTRPVSAPLAEVQLKRPLGRAAPQLLLQRMNLSADLRASIVAATCEAASRRGKVRRRPLPQPAALPPPVPPAAPATAKVIKRAKAVPLAPPPRMPGLLRELEDAIRLVGAVTQGAVLQAENQARLVGLVGAMPPNVETAKHWKAVLKAHRPRVVEDYPVAAE